MNSKTLSHPWRAGLLAASFAALLPAADTILAQPAPKPAPHSEAVVIPIDARRAMEDCRRQGFAATRRNFLGIEATPISPELRRHFGASAGAGVLVARVIEDGPAARAGIEVGDVLTRCAGEEVSEPHDLRSAVKGRKNGESVTVELFRGGKPRQVAVVVEEKDICSFDVGQVLDAEDFAKLADLGKLGELDKLGYLKSLEDIDVDIDISGLDLDELVRNAVKIAVVGLDQALDSRAWERQIEDLQEEKAEELKLRMQEVARHLEQLERKIEAESGRYGEKARKEMERAREELRQDLAQRKAEIEREVGRSLEKARREAEETRRELEEDRRRDGKGGGEMY